MTHCDVTYDFAPEWITKDLGVSFNQIFKVLSDMDISTDLELEDFSKCKNQINIITIIST